MEKSLAGMLIGVAAIPVPAQELVQTGRYTAVAALATEAQREPLQEVLTVRFPDEVATVGAALAHVLSGSGYALSDTAGSDAEALGFFDWPLPDIQRVLGPLTRRAVLETLAGAAFRIVVDPLRRAVHVELEPDVRAHGAEGSLDASTER